MDCTALSRDLSTGRAANRAQERVPSTVAVSPVVLSGHVVSGPSIEEAGPSTSAQQQADCQLLGSAGQRRGSQAPPASNTGVLTALVDWALVDWLSYTIPDTVPLDAVLDALGAEGWADMDRGDLGYRLGKVRGRVCVLFDGNPGMGTHVRISGQGCREIEGDPGFRGWSVFLGSMIDLGAKFTRVDVAMDDEEGKLLSMPTIRASIKEGLVVSTYRKARGLADWDLKSGQEQAETIYFGSRKSDSMVRFYDRGAKLGMSESFVRCELELHDKQAQAMAQLIVDGAELGELLAGVLARKVDFKARGRHSQRERWDTAGWWLTFLAGVAKMRLGVAPVVRTLQRARAWLIRQAAPLFALVVEHQAGGADFLSDMLTEGQRRRKAWHRRILEAASTGPIPAGI